MAVRKATLNDFNKISDIYAVARAYMRANGNMKQWSDGYPYESTINADITDENLYVYEEADEILGVFALLNGPDKTYTVIYGGEWINNNEYGVIHRIAVCANRGGVASKCIEFCQKRYKNLRIDTHKDNVPMRSFLKKHRFIECGIIHLENGEERIAFQKVIS